MRGECAVFNCYFSLVSCYFIFYVYFVYNFIINEYNINYVSCVSVACTGAAGSKHEAIDSSEAGVELDDSR